MADWVGALPEAEKDTLLLRVVSADPHVGTELRRRFRTQQSTSAHQPGTRTVGDLLAAAGQRRTIRERKQTRLAAEQRARREKAAALAREHRLDELASREDHAWYQVNDLINTKRPADYDAAVALLTDLKALNDRSGASADFADRCRQLRIDHRRKPSLIQRFDRAGL